MGRSLPELLRRGAYFHDLLSDQDWIVRRVQTFEFLDLTSAKIRTSVTIDYSELLARANEFGGAEPYVEVPLGLLPKQLFGAFDICDSASRTLALVGSDYDSEAALSVLIYELYSQGIVEDRLSDSLIEKLLRVTRRQDGDNMANDIDYFAATVDNPDHSRIEEIFGHDLYQAVFDLDDIDEFISLLAAFSDQYIPIFRCEPKSLAASPVVKYSQVTHAPELALYNKGAGINYMLQPHGGSVDIRSVNLGMEGSQHFRVAAPNGTVITSAVVVDPETERATEHSHLKHITPRWASLYSKFRDDLGAHDVRITLIPDANATMVPAVAALSLSLVIIGTGLILGLTDAMGHRTSRLNEIAGNSSGAIVAIFLLLPSLFMLALVRRDEHDVASSLLRVPRRFIVLASSVSILATVPAVFSVGAPVVAVFWIAAFVVSVIVLALVCNFWWRTVQLQEVARSSWNVDQEGGFEANDHALV